MSVSIQSVPFIKGYRAVISDVDSGEGVLVIERLDAETDDWLVEQMFPCSSRIEALGISSAFAAQVISHLDMNSLVARMTNCHVHMPGDLFISMLELDDGTFMALVEELDARGSMTVKNYRTDVPNFFEAYGWALSEATIASRGSED